MRLTKILTKMRNNILETFIQGLEIINEIEGDEAINAELTIPIGHPEKYTEAQRKQLISNGFYITTNDENEYVFEYRIF